MKDLKDEVSEEEEEEDDYNNPLVVGPNVLKVHLQQDQSRSFQFNPDTTAGDVVAFLCEKLNLKNQKKYTLVLVPSESKEQKLNLCSDEVILAEWDLIEKVLENPALKHYKCHFKLAFFENDIRKMSEEDSNSFAYHYNQCVHDVLSDSIYSNDLNINEVLRIASLQMLEVWLSNIDTCDSASNKSKVEVYNSRKRNPFFPPKKITLKQIEKQYGLKFFLPRFALQLVTSDSSSEHKKTLQQFLKANYLAHVNSTHQSTKASPDSSAPSEEQSFDLDGILFQLRMQYIKSLSPLHSYGGKCFDATILSSKNSDVTLIVGNKCGIGQLMNNKTKSVSSFCQFDLIQAVDVAAYSSADRITNVKIDIEDEAPLVVAMSPQSAFNFAYTIYGYCRVRSNNEMLLTVPISYHCSSPDDVAENDEWKKSSDNDQAPSNLCEFAESDALNLISNDIPNSILVKFQPSKASLYEEECRNEKRGKEPSSSSLEQTSSDTKVISEEAHSSFSSARQSISSEQLNYINSSDEENTRKTTMSDKDNVSQNNLESLHLRDEANVEDSDDENSDSEDQDVINADEKGEEADVSMDSSISSINTKGVKKTILRNRAARKGKHLSIVSSQTSTSGDEPDQLIEDKKKTKTKNITIRASVAHETDEIEDVLTGPLPISDVKMENHKNESPKEKSRTSWFGKNIMLRSISLDRGINKSNDSPKRRSMFRNFFSPKRSYSVGKETESPSFVLGGSDSMPRSESGFGGKWRFKKIFGSKSPSPQSNKKSKFSIFRAFSRKKRNSNLSSPTDVGTFSFHQSPSEKFSPLNSEDLAEYGEKKNSAPQSNESLSLNNSPKTSTSNKNTLSQRKPSFEAPADSAQVNDDVFFDSSVESSTDEETSQIANKAKTKRPSSLAVTKHDKTSNTDNSSEETFTAIPSSVAPAKPSRLYHKSSLSSPVHESQTENDEIDLNVEVSANIEERKDDFEQLNTTSEQNEDEMISNLQSNQGSNSETDSEKSGREGKANNQPEEIHESSTPDSLLEKINETQKIEEENLDTVESSSALNEETIKTNMSEKEEQESLPGDLSDSIQVSDDVDSLMESVDLSVDVEMSRIDLSRLDGNEAKTNSPLFQSINEESNCLNNISEEDIVQTETFYSAVKDIENSLPEISINEKGASYEESSYDHISIVGEGKSLEEQSFVTMNETSEALIENQQQRIVEKGDASVSDMEPADVKATTQDQSEKPSQRTLSSSSSTSTLCHNGTEHSVNMDEKKRFVSEIKTFMSSAPNDMHHTELQEAKNESVEKEEKSQNTSSSDSSSSDDDNEETDFMVEDEKQSISTQKMISPVADAMNRLLNGFENGSIPPEQFDNDLSRRISEQESREASTAKSGKVLKATPSEKKNSASSFNTIETTRKGWNGDASDKSLPEKGVPSFYTNHNEERISTITKPTDKTTTSETVLSESSKNISLDLKSESSNIKPQDESDLSLFPPPPEDFIQPWQPPVAPEVLNISVESHVTLPSKNNSDTVAAANEVLKINAHQIMPNSNNTTMSCDIPSTTSFQPSKSSPSPRSVEVKTSASTPTSNTYHSLIAPQLFGQKSEIRKFSKIKPSAPAANKEKVKKEENASASTDIIPTQNGSKFGWQAPRNSSVVKSVSYPRPMSPPSKPPISPKPFSTST